MDCLCPRLNCKLYWEKPCRQPVSTLKVDIDSGFAERNWVEDMEGGMQTAQVLELSDYTSAVCCLAKTGTAETGKGSIVSDQQKGAEYWKACSQG